MLQPNSPIPKFSLPDQDSVVHNSTEYKGKWLLIYFYPKDDTPGCTTEACSFRDNFAQFTKAGIEVIGISKDPVKSHKKFATKYELPFTLLSDTSTETIQAFGVWALKKFMGREYMGILRTTFLINPEGKVVKVYENVNPTDHAKQILADYQSLSH
jgi:thioredoxin-dependent peroxiredoxin